VLKSLKEGWRRIFPCVEVWWCREGKKGDVRRESRSDSDWNKGRDETEATQLSAQEEMKMRCAQHNTIVVFV
jgi:hypothetical protein